MKISDVLMNGKQPKARANCFFPSCIKLLESSRFFRIEVKHLRPNKHHCRNTIAHRALVGVCMSGRGKGEGVGRGVR